MSLLSYFVNFWLFLFLHCYWSLWRLATEVLKQISLFVGFHSKALKVTYTSLPKEDTERLRVEVSRALGKGDFEIEERLQAIADDVKKARSGLWFALRGKDDLMGTEFAKTLPNLLVFRSDLHTVYLFEVKSESKPDITSGLKSDETTELKTELKSGTKPDENGEKKEDDKSESKSDPNTDTKPLTERSTVVFDESISADKKSTALETAFMILHVEENYTEIANSILDIIRTKEDNDWNCLIFPRGPPKPEAEEIKENRLGVKLGNEHLFFGVGDIKVLLFSAVKPAAAPKPVEPNYVQEARDFIKNNGLKIEESNFTEAEKAKSLEILKTVLETCSSLWQITYNLKNEFDKQLKGPFGASVYIIGKGHAWYSKKRFLVLSIGPLRVDIVGEAN